MHKFKHLLHQLNLTPLTAILLGSWMFVMILVPIGLWTVGESSTPVLMLTAVCLQAAAVGTILQKSWGTRHTIAIFAALAFMGWLIEAIGTATGYPFGSYDYTERLQPQIAHVPLLIPLAWFMMLPVSWAVAIAINQQLSKRLIPYPLTFILLAAAAMTAWDLFLDPQMVLWEFWIWRDVPAISYFGIPWLNYFGWLFGSAVMTAVVMVLIRPNWDTLPLRPLLLIYSITWFLETFGLLFFWGLIGPALIGGIVMGTLMVLAWRPFVRLNQRVPSILHD